MKLASTWVLVGAIAVGLCASTPVSAQPARDLIVTGDDDRPWNRGVALEERRAARQLFLEGNRLFRIPLFARAAEQYTLALARWRHPAFHFNLAIAQLNLSQEVDARENLARAIEYGEAPLGGSEFQEARDQLAQVERQLGRIRVTCHTPGAQVSLDGTALFTGPGSEERWVAARSHEITAKKADHLSEARRVEIAAGQLQTLELKLITLGEATEGGRRWDQWKPWTVVAAGVAVTAAAGVVHALAARNFDRYDQEFLRLPCATMQDPKEPGCPEDALPRALRDRLQRATRQQQFAVAGYAVGGAALAAGAVLVYLNRPRLLERSAEPTGAVSVIPTLSPDAAGLVLRVTR
jgi:hypothetical protein